MAVVSGAAALTGLLLGAIVGGVLYEIAGPRWGEFGYEFEGFGWALRGALLGGIVGLGGTLVVALHAMHQRRSRRLLEEPWEPYSGER